jgi:hypothetical protein
MFTPIDNGRYVFAMQPILATPMLPRALFTPAGIYSFLTELLYLVIPSILLIGAIWLVTRISKSKSLNNNKN